MPFHPTRISLSSVMRAPALLRRPLLLFTFPALFLIYHLSFTGKPLPSTTAPPSPCFPFDPSNPTDDFEDGYTGPRVRQATMLYEGDKDRLRSMYERCVATHVKHGQRWGVPTHVLGHTLYEEHSFFNKPAYLQSLIMMELAKPVVKRADWIV